MGWPFCLRVSDRLVDPCLCFPFGEISLGFQFFSWLHSSAGVLIHIHAFSGMLLEKKVSLCWLGSFSLSFYSKEFYVWKDFSFLCCPPGGLSVLTEGVSPGSLGCYFPLSPGLFWIPLFLDGASPFSFSDVSILVGFFFSKGNAFFLRFFPVLRKLFRFRA